MKAFSIIKPTCYVQRPQWPTGWLWLTYYYYWSTLFVVHFLSAVLKCDNLSYRNFLNMIHTGSSLDIELCAFPPFGNMWPLAVRKWAFSHFMNRRKSQFCQRVNTSHHSHAENKIYTERCLIRGSTTNCGFWSLLCFANFAYDAFSNHDSANCSEVRAVKWSVIRLWKFWFAILVNFTPILWKHIG